jgi:hypothetical protein
MAEFVFALTPDSPDSLGAKIMTELNAMFPDHAFMYAKSGNFDEADFSNAIIPIEGTIQEDGNTRKVPAADPKVVAEVKLAFKEMLTEMKGWKPS